MTQLMVLKKTGHKRTTSRRQRQPSSGVSTTSRPPIRGCRQGIPWSPGPGQATSPSSSSSFLPGSPGPDQARLPGYQAVVFFFLLARFTRSGLGQAARLPGRRLLLPSCKVHQVQDTSLLASTRSRPPVFLLLSSP